jgi:hypothetical protein
MRALDPDDFEVRRRCRDPGEPIPPDLMRGARPNGVDRAGDDDTGAGQDGKTGDFKKEEIADTRRATAQELPPPPSDKQT